MTLTDVLPSRANDFEGIGLIPVADVHLFIVPPQSYESFGKNGELIREVLGGRAVAGFTLGEIFSTELTEQPIDSGSVAALMLGNRGQTGLISATVDSFITHDEFPDTVIFEHHHLFRRGTQETHSEPRPYDDSIGLAVNIMMTRILEQHPIRTVD